MNVRELINLLKKLPKAAQIEVSITAPDYGISEPIWFEIASVENEANSCPEHRLIYCNRITME